MAAAPSIDAERRALRHKVLIFYAKVSLRAPLPLPARGGCGVCTMVHPCTLGGAREGLRSHTPEVVLEIVNLRGFAVVGFIV